MKLAILIPTFDGREHFLERLVDQILMPQLPKYENDVMLLINKDQGWRNGGKHIGDKRNELEHHARLMGATHRIFLDCDDRVSEDFLDLNMPGVYGDYDCNSLVGIYTVNGYKDPKKHIFLHSLKYTHWYEDDTYFYRNPNHLNCVKLSKIEGIKFQSKSDGEDGCWSEDLAKAGTLKTEYEITQPFYYYDFRSKPNGI